MKLFHDKVFDVTTECGQDQRTLCSDTTFCVLIELVKARSSMSRQILALGKVLV